MGSKSLSRDGQSRWVIQMDGTQVMEKLRQEEHVKSLADPGLLTPTTVLLPLHGATLGPCRGCPSPS